MVSRADGPSWVTIECPVCGASLGMKKKDEIKSFTCAEEGCSKTEHTFYPGQIKRPGKSKPWASYHKAKSICKCSACQARHSND